MQDSQCIMSGEEQVVTVEVDVKAEDEAPDLGETEAQEGGETAAPKQPEPPGQQEEAKQGDQDSGSEDEQGAGGRVFQKHAVDTSELNMKQKTAIQAMRVELHCFTADDVESM